jgi:hypothetical protein
MKKFLVLAVSTIILVLPAFFAFGAEGEANKEEKPLLRAAIFVQNRAGEAFQDKLDVLNDLITTRLTEKGFSIIDKDVVVAKFRESRSADPATRKELQLLESAASFKKIESPVEDAISSASALRISQMIGADYIVVATINSMGQETKNFTGYGTKTQTKVFTLRIALKVLEGNQGGSVYGDLVTVSERLSLGQNLTIETTDIIAKLLDQGAVKIADNVSGKVERIRDVKVKSLPTVEITINSNVEGAVVELDGAAIGSAPGRFNAAPGLHQLRISKEWLTTWERTVNIFPNQVMTVSLELTEEGLRRYTSLEKLKAELATDKERSDMALKERDAAIGIAKEQSEAEAFSKKQIAEGEKKRREESFERTEGPATINNYR